jgi:ATP synthase protein I
MCVCDAFPFRIVPMPETPKGSTPPSGEMNPEDRAAFERRLSDLGSKIDGAQADKQAEITAQEDKAMRARGMAYGLRMSSEFVAAIVVGGLIGFGLDKLLGTTPWLFLLFFVLGLVAGIVNVTRAFERLQGEIKKQTGGNMGRDLPDDDDD